MVQFINALVYGLATLTTLWAAGGGNSQVFWSRQLALAIVLWVLAFSTHLGAKKAPADFLKIFLHWNQRSLGIAVATAVAAAIPVALVIYAVKASFLVRLGIGPETMISLAPTHFSYILISVLLVAPASELIWRGHLSPAWGIGSVAFLQALNIGFGLQHLAPFLAIWGMGYVWGQLAKHFGIGSAALSRAVWSLLILSALAVF